MTSRKVRVLFMIPAARRNTTDVNLSRENNKQLNRPRISHNMRGNPGRRASGSFHAMRRWHPCSCSEVGLSSTVASLSIGWQK